MHGQPATVVPRIASALSATEVHISADYGPYGRRRDEQVAKALAAKDIELHATGSPYAVAPGRVRKSDGSRYAVFTPYWHAWSEHGWREARRWSRIGGLGGSGRAARQALDPVRDGHRPARADPAGRR